MVKDYYQILEISKWTSLEDMEKAYKKLAKKWHPDKWRNSSEADRLYAEEMMKDINEAHDALKKSLPLSPKLKSTPINSFTSSESKPKSKYAHENDIWDVDLNKLSNSYFGFTSKDKTNSTKSKESLWADADKITKEIFQI